jgi:hypothetical protein
MNRLNLLIVLNVRYVINTETELKMIEFITDEVINYYYIINPSDRVTKVFNHLADVRHDDLYVNKANGLFHYKKPVYYSFVAITNKLKNSNNLEDIHLDHLSDDELLQLKLLRA